MSRPSPCPLGADSHILCSLLPPGHLSRDPACWIVLFAPSPCGYSLNLGCFFRVAISGHQLQEAFLTLSSGLDTTHLYFSSNHSFFFWLHLEACGILVPRPGIKPTTPTSEAWNLNYWTAKEVPFYVFKICFLREDCPVCLLPGASCLHYPQLTWYMAINI